MEVLIATSVAAIGIVAALELFPAVPDWPVRRPTKPRLS
jgi:hypothetical protein